jgi:hypothetical protein
LGAELVYGDWSGAFTDVTIGAAFNMPFRFLLHQEAAVRVGLHFEPGLLVGDPEGRVSDFLFGVRGSIVIPVTIPVHQRVNIVTGAALPITVVFADGFDPYVVIPVLIRMGVEVQATRHIVPSLLFEVGPGFAVGDFGASEVAFRIWVGTSFF